MSKDTGLAQPAYARRTRLRFKTVATSWCNLDYEPGEVLLERGVCH